MTEPARRVFICRDTVLDSVLDPLADALTARGVLVSRGARNVVGERKRYGQDEIAELVALADVAVMTIRHLCSREFIERAPRLRGVCYPTIGVETVDLEAATERCVAVGNGATPGNVIGMAEATIMLALNLLYDLRDSASRLSAGFPKPAYPRARSLSGKTIGFIGFGHIASAMAERLRPFGVRMLAYGPRLAAGRLPGDVERRDLEDLLSQSDAVFVLVSLNETSRGLIGRAELACMKPTAYLINTARGEVIDEEALCEVLKAGRIAGAALDTFAQEPLPADSPLRQLSNVILTPHMVGQTAEAHDEFGPALLANVESMLNGRLPPLLKNKEVAARWLARWGKA